MEPSFNLATLLNLLGAAQALLLSVALFSIARGNKTANRLLAALAFTIAILVASSVLITTHYINFFPHLIRVNHPFDFLGGPLIYLYIRTLTTRRNLEKKDFLHFAPFALCVLYLSPFYLQSGAYKLNDMSSPDYVQWYYIRTAIAILLGTVYVVCTGLMLVSYSRKASQSPAPEERATLAQARLLVFSFLALIGLAILRYLFDVAFPAYTRYTNLVLPLGATAFVYVLAYSGLKKSTWSEAETIPTAKKYERSNLTAERSERYLSKLLEVMETDKPYTDGELTIQKLAERLRISAPHLSQTINELLHQSFSDFINTYRVEEAKRQLLDPKKQHYSILAIAEEVGFNSKSSFNAAFRKYTNLTPSEFRKAANGNGPI